MTGEDRGTVKVPFTVADMQKALSLPTGQQVLRMYVVDDPMALVVVVEGGEELPAVTGGADPHTVEAPYLRRGPGWPQPGPDTAGERRRAKVVLGVLELAAALRLGAGQAITLMYVDPDPHTAWVMVEGVGLPPAQRPTRVVLPERFLRSQVAAAAASN